jgi:exonuclease 3'-5' domain-containing protein 1
MVTSKFPQEQWFRMFKTPNDLSTFLKLFSDCFHIQANLVTLLQKPKLSDSHIKQAQDRFMNTSAASSAAAASATAYKNARNENQLNNRTITPNYNQFNNSYVDVEQPPPTEEQQLVGDFKLNEPVSANNLKNMSNNNNNNVSYQQPTSGFDSFINNEIKLENLCATNCPTASIGSYYPNSTTSTSSNSPSNTPLSTSTQTLATTPESNRNAHINNKYQANQTLKQRINSLVIKTLAENLEKDKQSMSALNTHNNMYGGGTAYRTANAVQQPPQQLQQQQPQLHTNYTPNNSPSHNNSNNYFSGDTWKIKVLQNTRVISTIKESVFVCDAILKSSHSHQVLISFDCEGINLGAKGQLTLAEIGTTRGEAFIFDLLTCPGMVLDGGLKQLLECDNVIKIIHDCRNDSVNLYNQYGIVLRNVFDTQSAHACIQFQESGKQVYKVKNVSLNTLCEVYKAPINPMKDQLKNVYRRDQKYWARRPLTKEMLLYAAGDALVLINEQLYANLARFVYYLV